MTDVYANGMNIACKAAAGKTVAAMPDVCLSPPTPPAGPVPIPYPNTAMASDTTDGSKTVQIGGDEVMLKNKSSFKQSNGDEAATKSLGMGVVTHQIQGKVNFCAWSMDVKFEGENVPRHLDLTGHNEMSDPPNAPPWPYLDSMSISLDHPCVSDMKKEHEACKKYSPNTKESACPPEGKPRTAEDAIAYSKKVKSNPCLRARRCMLQPYSKTKKGKGGCCPGQTGHHLVPEASFKAISKYKASAAPCICVEGTNHGHGTHGMMHTVQSYGYLKSKKANLRYAQRQGAGAVKAVFPESGCNPKCIEAQLASYHEDEAGISPDQAIDPIMTNLPDTKKVRDAIALAKSIS